MNAWDELHWRGLVHQNTPRAKEALSSPTTVFCGFDPTADSLHVGNLVGLLVLRRLRLAGHRTVAVLGAGTCMVGDPSGKSSERALMPVEEIGKNSLAIERQVREVARPDVIVSNASWLGGMGLIDFLRGVGKHFPVNELMRRRSVELRRDGGMSFAELAYGLLQALDFVRVSRDHGVTVQVGGSDQFGNIAAGVELARRQGRGELHGLTWPLLVGADGAKLGKTERGAVWLDPGKTTPFDFFQFWRSRPDQEVGRLLRWLTFLNEQHIAWLETRQSPQQRQRVLAERVTAIVHGEEAALSAAAKADALFGGDASRAEGVEVEADREIPLLDLLMLSGLWRSRGEAKRDLRQGGVSIDGRPADPGLVVPVLRGRVEMLVGRGKRNRVVMRIGPKE